MTSTLLREGSGTRAPRADLSEGRALTVRTLGSFVVTRDGVPLTIGDWQSRKVRDLFKVLLTRRGRALTRDAVLELLWPDVGVDDDHVRSRLSVTLSTLRKVLDPERRYAPDHYVAADRSSITLRTEHVAIDLVELLETVTRAEDAAERSAWDSADRLLGRACVLYAGDFLEEDLFEDWAVDCRELARSAVQRAARLRVESALWRGDDGSVVRHLEWLLGLDPYDEPAWQQLLETLRGLRRHGEVRRHHARYARRMTEIGVVPQPL